MSPCASPRSLPPLHSSWWGWPSPSSGASSPCRATWCPPQFALLELATGAWRFHALVSIAETGIAAELAKGPRTAAELAQALGLHTGAVFRVLRALATDGLLKRSGDHFSHTRISACLAPDHPSSVFHSVQDFGQEYRLQMFARMGHTLRTGEPSWDTMGLGTFWSFLDEHPGHRARFDASMAEFTRDSLGPHVRAYDFGQHRTVVDIGGGTGTLLSAILSLHPGVRGVLFDRQGALDQAGPILEHWNTTDRITLEPGDFHAAIPAGHGCYVARHVLHMLPDDVALDLLKTWRPAFEDDAKLVILEIVVPEDGPYLQFLDMVMLVAAGGKERTRAEFQALLGAAGFSLERVIETAAPIDLIVAAPA